MIADQVVRDLATKAPSRYELWIDLIRTMNAERVAEIGVYRGGFASKILAGCDAIRTYYMVDPWKHLDDWNKPSNRDDERFAKILDEAKAKTAFAGDKRVFLRGRTTEVIDEIPDSSLDFVYIDGDHTLRGIVIDLMRVLPKVRPGGWIGGDDFTATIWQHDARYEPTFVFPFAVYFAEGAGVKIIGLPHAQFLIEKPVEHRDSRFEFVDLTGIYKDTSLRGQVYPALGRRVAGALSVDSMWKRVKRFAKDLLRR